MEIIICISCLPRLARAAARFLRATPLPPPEKPKAGGRPLRHTPSMRKSPGGDPRFQDRRPRVEREDDTPAQNPLLRGNACFLAADLIGARPLITQALDDRAGNFCQRFGFRAFSERGPLMLLLRISDLRGALEGQAGGG